MNPKRRKWPVTRHTRGMRALRWRSRMRMLMQWMPRLSSERKWKLELSVRFLAYWRHKKVWLLWEARPTVVRARKEWRLR